METRLKNSLRMAKVLIDIADDLLWERLDEINELEESDKEWVQLCFSKTIEAHNDFLIIYCKDPDFMDGEKEIKQALREAVETNFEIE